VTIEHGDIVHPSPEPAAHSPSPVIEPRATRHPGRGRPIVLIEKRALNRDCISKALISGYGLNVISVGDIGDWAKISPTTAPAMVLLFVSGLSIESQITRTLETLPKSDPPPFIVFSDDENIEHIVSALERGARGYIASTTPLDVVVEAIRLVIAGGTFVPASSIIAAQRTTDGFKTANNQLTVEGFTPRQAAIIEKLRIGKSNKLIAYELSMCESTVKVHVRNIMKKLNAKNRTEVAFLASRLNR
jgi:DNA-binding NarL/FixJ family response regulator